MTPNIFAARKAVSPGNFSNNKAVLLWANDGLKVVFCILIGLELKHEVMKVQLATHSQIILPVVAAPLGFLLPEAISPD